MASFLPALRFRALTRIYDPAIRWTTREETFKQRLLEQAGIEPGDRILDLGCGTGTLAIMAKGLEPSAEVVGLDADPQMLEQAETKAAKAGADTRFDQGLSDRLPYPDDSFDLILSSLFFHHLVLEDKRKTVAEIARVLKPGGRLHIADWGKPQDPLMAALSLVIRFADGPEPTRDNLSGALPRIFEEGGLTEVTEAGSLRTIIGTLAFYRAAARPWSPVFAPLGKLRVVKPAAGPQATGADPVETRGICPAFRLVKARRSLPEAKAVRP